MVKNDIVDVNLNSGTVFRSFANVVLGEGDEDAVVFGARLFRDGEPVHVAGMAAVGYFVRADGVTEVLSDEALCTGNVVQVTVPAACYAVEGNYTLSIKLIGTGFSSTVRMVDGTVVSTTNGALADPGSVIPDLSDLEEAVEDAETAADIVAGVNVYAQQISGDEYRVIVNGPTGE